jgi:hypothetical protein
MQNKHYNDADLLAFLDCEIPVCDAQEVQRHLDECAACRERFIQLCYELQSVREQVQRLQPPAGWHERARANLRAYEEAFERKCSHTERRRWWLKPAFALVMVACVIAIIEVTLPRANQQVAPQPATLARLNAFEASLSTAKVHQIFRVETNQVRPAGPSHESSLEIWSDGESGQFASRWTASSGVLKHALWHPGKSVSYVYGPRRAERPGDDLLGADLMGRQPSAEQFESYFLHWLDRRPWKPIVLLPDLGLWERHGERVQVERVSAQELRVVARRQVRDAVLVFTALLNYDDGQPKLQVLHLESPQGVAELRLTSDHMERVSRIPDATFEPDRTALYTRHEPEFTRVLPPAPARSPEDGEQAAREVAILSALHNAGACLGKAVIVTQGEEGVLVAEAGASPASGQPALITAGGPADVMAILSDIRSSQRHLAVPPDGVIPAATRRQIQDLLQNSSALALLAQKFPDERISALPARSKRQLGRIMADHARALEQEFAELAEAVPRGAVMGPGAQRSAERRQSWQALALDLKQQMELLVTSPDAWLSANGARARLEVLAVRARALADRGREEFNTVAAEPNSDQARY